MQKIQNIQKKFFWYQKIQRSWIVNALILPVVIALLCGLIVAWIK